jgi:hypothetical protein
MKLKLGSKTVEIPLRPRRHQYDTKQTIVTVEIATLDQNVVQTLTDDMERAGWGVPMSTMIKLGVTTLRYVLEVDPT